jgi:hypothetical protein
MAKAPIAQTISGQEIDGAVTTLPADKVAGVSLEARVSAAGDGLPGSFLMASFPVRGRISTGL